MLKDLFFDSEPKIVVTEEKTVLYARTRVVSALTFTTMAFLAFFVVDFDRTAAKLGIWLWSAGFALGLISLYIGVGRMRDTRPLMVITAEGVSLPRQFADMIPWSAVSEIKFSNSVLTLNFKEGQRLKWYPRLTLIPGDPGVAGDGFFSSYDVPWVRVRLNYMWPVNAKTLRKLIADRQPSSSTEP